MTKRESKAMVQSLDRGLALLEALTGGEQGVTELASLLAIDKSTIYRLLATLEERGFVAQNPRNRKYRLGMSCLQLAGSVLGDLDIRSVAEPFLRRLNEETGETIFLGLLSGQQVVYVEKIRSRWPLAVSSEVGMRAHPHCTATAKAVLAFLPAEEALDWLRQAPLPAFTPRTITDPEQVIGHLEQVRARGYALDDEEFCIGLRCVAAPVFDHSGRVRGSISLSGPSHRVSLERVHELGRLVAAAAHEMSSQLGLSKATA